MIKLGTAALVACTALAATVRGAHAQEPPPLPPPAESPPSASVAEPAPPAPWLAPTAPSAPAPGALPPPDTDEWPARDRRGKPLPARPNKLAWEPGEVVPPGYEPWSAPSRKLMISGIVVSGTFYFGSFITAFGTALAGNFDEFGVMFIPLVGPLIAIETAGAEDSGAYLLVLDTLGQAAGLALLFTSFGVKDHGLKKQRRDAVPQVSGGFGPTGANLRVEF